MKNLIFILVAIITLIAAFTIHSPLERAIVAVLGIFVICGVQALHGISPGRKNQEKIENSAPVMLFANQESTPLETLAIHSAHCENDDLGECVDKIVHHANQIAVFQQQVDNTFDEVIRFYSAYIDEYIRKAISIVKNHAEVKDYLSTCNPESLQEEIGSLEAQSKEQPELKVILDEKKKSLLGIEAMQRTLEKNIQDLREIEATLQALSTAIASARTNNLSEREFRKELQKTLSSTSEIIRETLR